MNRTFGYFILAGLLIGAVFGLGLGVPNGHALLGTGIGALAGIFIGWFPAAARFEKK